VENRKKGDVLRNASADGSAARARAPSSVFAMLCVMLDSCWGCEDGLRDT
jgi:hypothetical protein